MRTALACALICLILLTGCKDNRPVETPGSASAPAEAIPLKAAPLLSSPLQPRLVETTSEAVPAWRSYQGNRPLLAFLGKYPCLMPIPESEQKKTREALQSLADEELRQATDHFAPAPPFLPEMAVSAALDAGYFSGVVWVFPSSQPPDKLDLEVFRRQLVESAVATEDEADAFTLEAGVFKGTVRGIPLMAVHPLSLPRLDAPMLLHIDLNYFPPLYKGEIKTPIYPLVVQTLAGIKEAQWQVAAVTLCRSNLAAELPLASRFLADAIVDLLKNPGMLTEEMPIRWDLRSRALYLENFLQQEESRRLYLELEKVSPEDPSVKFALYQSSRNAKQPEQALRHLEEAVALDPVYALEYQPLADLALEKARPEKSIEMLTLAQAALPHDPWLKIQLVRTYLGQGQMEPARKLIAELRQSRWSQTYFANIDTMLNGWAQFVGGEE